MKIKTLASGIIPTLIFNFKAFGVLNSFRMKFPIFVGGGSRLEKFHEIQFHLVLKLKLEWSI